MSKKYISVFEWRYDEQFRTFAEGCCETIRTIDSGGNKYVLLKDNIDRAEQSRAEQSRAD